MAIPTTNHDWATATVILPLTGQSNKAEPSGSIQSAGMDYSQVLTCEEDNYWRASVHEWLDYIVDEKIPAVEAITLTAGVGLTGGGNLTNNRTFALGTPSDVNATSDNTVTGETHSHKLVLPAADETTAGVLAVATDADTVTGTRDDVALTPLKLANNFTGFFSGMISPFAGLTAPDGFLICDGSALSRTTYADLFAVIGTLYGNGDGVTTFNIPDLRGEFLRGNDNGRGIDTGRVLGSSQTESIISHSHDYVDRYYIESAASLSTTTEKETVPGGNYNGNRGSQGTDTDNDTWLTYDSTTSPAGSTETRPRNVSVNYIIKT